MLAYILLIIIPILYMGILLGLRKTYYLSYIPYNNTVLYVFFFCFFILLTIRASTVGIDTPNYLRKFHMSAYLTWLEIFTESESEIGFGIITKLISVFTTNDQVYLGIMSALILSPIAYLYSKESEKPFLTMTMFMILPMFGMSFSGLRQAIAISLAVPAYFQLKKRNKIKFILIIVVSMMFHRSSFILFIMYPVYYMKMNKKRLYLIIPFILAVYFFRENIFSFLLQILSFIYTDHEWELTNTSAWAMLALFIVLLVFCFIFVDENKADEDILGLRNYLIISVILQCFSSINVLAMRMNYYFLIFLPILIPKVMCRVSGKNTFTCRVINCILCLYFLVYFLDLGFGEKSGFEIFPYIPFWK